MARGRGRGRGMGRGGRGGGRGRGRGSSRGRGGFRGRGGRGGGRGRGASNNSAGDNVEKKDPVILDINSGTDVRDFFTGTVSVDDHYKAQTDNRDRYAAGMAALEKNGVEVAQNARVRALAAAWARKDHDLASAFLKNREWFGLVEVLKAVQLLDSGRQIRVIEKKMKRLQTSGSKVSGKKLGKLKSDMDNLAVNKPSVGSASGAVAKHITQWVRTFTKEELEFYALHFPKESWKKLADICHFNPEKDFPQLPWFLKFCFGAPAPEDTMVYRGREVTADNVNDLIKEFPVPYSHLKAHTAKLTDESKMAIANYEAKLDTLLWYYEDLNNEEVDKVITARLAKGEQVNLPNGKLLERLLTMKMLRENIQKRRYCYGSSDEKPTPTNKAPFLPSLIPLAEERVSRINLSLEAPIVVIGDASSSMDVAIQTSTIIAGLLTKLAQARLVFFNTENRDAPYLPETIEQVLDLAMTNKANGATAPAASLWPFYERKEVIKTFIMVTDEEENTSFKDHRFCALYKKYHDEVFPAKLVFVSFLRSQHSKGQMIGELHNAGFSPLEFKLDQSRPDLTKLDTLFGLLSAETNTFQDQVAAYEKEIKNKNLAKVFDDLKVSQGDTIHTA